MKLVLIALIALASPVAAQRYTVFDGIPVSINEGGDVAGRYGAGGFVRKSDGSMATFNGIPTSINQAGAVTGYILVQGKGDGYFLRDPQGNMTVFDLPQPVPMPPIGRAVAINDRGEIAGYFIECFMCDLNQGFVRSRNGDITMFAISDAMPESINARGDIAGHSTPYNYELLGFVRYRSGEIITFDIPGANGPGPRAHAVSINNRGDVAGYFQTCSMDGCRLRSFVRESSGKITVFDATLDASATLSAGINELGDVVGNFSDATGGHCFVRRWNGNISVFDGPNGSSAQCVTINNSGNVAGYFWAETGTRGFIRSDH